MKPSAVFAFLSGTDAVRFIRQYEEFGLKGKIPLFTPGYTVDSDTLPAQGDAALGVVNAMSYCDTLDTPENKQFVASFRKKYGIFPSIYAEQGYVTGLVMAEGLRKVGDPSNKKALVEAMASLKIAAPRGPVSFRADNHEIIHNTYIREVAYVDGRLTNKVIQAVPPQ
jgi:branched-chain amino acid transport system substrate-binding protein